ncbi:MAG TPA: FeoB small GTPase domain-containing protein, partial [Opitutales bacterium]|nr:FeoB small GTPase domain-containing protein [Opitutales bacterium]
MDGTQILSTGARPRVFALVGNPNCGKTTLFNALTGLRQKVGNYPGVTVERKTGKLYSQHGEALEIIDLPGSYSLHPRSPDEAITSAALLGNNKLHARPEGIVCVIDASNLERHLYLATQVIELGLPTIVALNMMDTALSAGISVDAQRLAQELGAPVIPCQATKPASLVALKVAISQLREKAKPHWSPLGSPEFREAVSSLAHCIEHEQGFDKRDAQSRAQWYLTEPNHTQWQP